MRIKVYITINSASYVLPLTNNLSIVFNSGTTTITTDMSMLADAEITIKPNAKVVINSNKSLYIYDKDERQGTTADGTAHTVLRARQLRAAAPHRRLPPLLAHRSRAVAPDRTLLDVCPAL